MKNYPIYFLSIFLICFCCKEKEISNESFSQPNIIIIHVDDLGFSDIGSFGSDFYETPHIDQLAKAGMKFTNSYAAAAICSPTRAALMTGKYPSRLGLTDWIRARFQGGIIPPDGNNPTGFDENEGRTLKTPKNPLFLELEEKTIAEYLKENGYYSAHIGKWHLGQEAHYPELRGFDENFGGCDLGQPPSYFDPYSPPNGKSDYVIPNLKPRKEGEYLTDREGDEAVKFISANKDRNFFLHWAPYAVHTPLQGKEELIEKYRQKPSTNQTNPVYAAMVESVDQNVGKLIKTLDSLELTDNTIVLFTSDNGGLLGNEKNPVTNNYPLRSGKGYPYEGGIKIPTIIKWPRAIKAGVENDTPIITMDILPTLMRIIDPDFNITDAEMDGADISPLLKGEPITLERDLFWHFPHYRTGDVVPYTIIRSGQYKLIKYYDDKDPELYDLKNDGSETTDLALDHPELVLTLEEKIDQWIEDTGARLPVRKSL